VLRIGVCGEPVEIVHVFGKVARPEAGVAKDAVAFAVHQEVVAAGLALLSVLVPQFPDAGDFFWREDPD